MRIWHLIDAAAPHATATTLALLAESHERLGDFEQHVVLLGGRRLRRIAAAVGIHRASAVGVPFGRAVLGYRPVQRLVGDLGAPDLVHCWSVGAACLAAMLFRRAAKVLSLTVAPSPAAARWLRVLTGDGGGRAVLLPISATIRRAALSHGVPEAAVHVLRPGLDVSRVDHGERTRLRDAWGVDDSIRVIAMLADPPEAGDARGAMLAVGLADECLHPDRTGICLLMHPDAVRRRRAVRAMAHVGRPERSIVDSRADQPWRVLPGCDAALAQGPAAGGLSLLWAMSANVPIVGEATYAVSEWVEDRHSALLARPGHPKYLTHRLCRLLSESQLAWSLRDAARHEAYSFFSRQRYCQSLQVVYRQVIEARPVEVPPLESTGGLRFSGRG